MVCDDYGFASCPGARKAVDEYFSGRADVPIELPSGQALIFHSG
jgi:O-methyltransferase